MQGRIFFTAAAILIFAFTASSQILDWNVSVIGRGMLSTSSRLYQNPESPSFDLRIRNTPFSSGYGAGLELRLRRPEDNYFFYVSGEYLSQSVSQFKLDGSLTPPRQVPIDEGYLMIPVEAGGQVYIPLGSDRWRLSMGGGIGGYYAERLLTVARVTASPSGTSIGFGIHVGLNFEYSIRPRVSLIGGVKFRDPEVDVRNVFDSPTTVYTGGTITFPQGEIKSRINVDGLTLHMGILIEIS